MDTPTLAEGKYCLLFVRWCNNNWILPEFILKEFIGGEARLVIGVTADATWFGFGGLLRSIDRQVDDKGSFIFMFDA
ncbi:MAG: hypothetical protein EA353_01420 [Puniceicoccaceae bacterium]|nr:MAG: hypothetical protein EA353_01420 [Puniceicoccaceae bacterium]